MNRRLRSHDDENVRRRPEQDDAETKQHAARPEEWQALQRALGNQRFQQLMRQQQAQRTRQKAINESPLLIPPGMQARISEAAGADAGRQSLPGGEARIHEGPQAESLARDLGARAFAQGRDIFVGGGGLDEVTLAHELTHVAEGTAPVGSVQRLGLDEEEEEVIVIDDDIIDPTETMDPFAGQPANDYEPIDPTETMDPFKDEKPRKVESIDPTETMDPFKEEKASDGSRGADADAKSVGLEADFRTTSEVGNTFQTKVVVPVQEAVSFLNGGKDNAEETYENLQRALSALYEIATTYKGSAVLTEQMATGFNMLYALKEMIAPHIGKQSSIEDIQRQLAAAANGMEALMKRLDIQGTVE